MSKPVALIVDDSPYAREDAESALPPDKYAVDFASSGEEAIEKISQTPYDLILLDLQMKGLNGFDVLRSMLGIEEEERPYVAIVSSSDAKRDATEAYALGADTFLNKPLIDDSDEPCLLRCLVIRPKGVVRDASSD